MTVWENIRRNFLEKGAQFFSSTKTLRQGKKKDSIVYLVVTSQINGKKKGPCPFPHKHAQRAWPRGASTATAREANTVTGALHPFTDKTRGPTAENNCVHLPDHYIVTTYLALIWK